MVPNIELVGKHLEIHDKPKLLVAGNRSWKGGIDTISFESLDR